MVQPTPTASPSTQARIGFGNVASVAEHAGHRLDQPLVLGRVEEFGKIAAEAKAAGQPPQHHDARFIIFRGGAKRAGKPVIGAPVKQRAAIVRGDRDGQDVIAEFGFRKDFHAVSAARHVF